MPPKPEQEQYSADAKTPAREPERSAPRIEPVRINPGGDKGGGKPPAEQGEAEVDTSVAPSQTKTTAPKSSRIPTVRTYKSDVNAALQEEGQSLTKIALAAQQKRRRPKEAGAEDEEGGGAKRMFVISIAVLLALSGVGALGAAAWYFFLSGEEDAAPEITLTQQFIFAEERTTVELPRMTRPQIRARVEGFLQNPELRIGAFRQIIFTRPGETPEGAAVQELIPLREVLPAAAPGVPAGLIRALGKNAFFGIHVLENTAPLLVFEITSYEQAFAGMLSWERTFPTDMNPLLAIETPPAGSQFRDELIRNRDARVLRTPDGEVVALYAFPNRQTLVMTTETRTFTEALNRLASPSPEN